MIETAPHPVSRVRRVKSKHPIHPIRQLREEAGLTQHDLAVACRVAGGHVVSNWENWRSVPYRRTAVEMAAVFKARLGREIDPSSLRPTQEGVRNGLPTA